MQTSTRTHRRIAGLTGTGLFLTGMAAALGGCPGSGTPTPQAGVTDVAISGLAFAPKEVTIRVNETVRWTNDDGVLHTVTSGNPGAADAGSQFNSGLIAPGGTFEWQFDAVGEYVYFCTQHASMPAMRDAKVIVQP